MASVVRYWRLVTLAAVIGLLVLNPRGVTALLQELVGIFRRFVTEVIGTGGA